MKQHRTTDHLSFARRGIPTEIFSDNGSNFIGAHAELKKMFQIAKTPQMHLLSNGHLSKEFSGTFLLDLLHILEDYGRLLYVA